MSLDKSCFKVLFREPALETAPATKEEPTRPEGTELAELLAPAFAKFPCVVPPPRKGEGSSPERSPPVGQEPASEVWYKAPPPKKTLSSMLSSYEEEEPLEPEAELGVRPLGKRLTSDAARERAAQRRGRAEVRPVLEEAPSIEDPAAGAAASETGGLLPGSVWDPATGQFVSEPIPDDILQSFKKEKDLKLEDYQERVLMAQLAEKKRRLEYQKEEAERRVRMKKIEEERAKQQELLRQQQPPQPQSHRPPHDSVLGALLAYETAEALGAAAQKTEEEQTPELSPPANPESPPPGPDQPEMQAASVPVDVQMVPGTSTQLPEADQASQSGPQVQAGLESQAQLLNVQLQAQPPDSTFKQDSVATVQSFCFAHRIGVQLSKAGAPKDKGKRHKDIAQQLATLQSLLNLYSRMPGPRGGTETEHRSSPLTAGPAIPLEQPGMQKGTGSVRESLQMVGCGTAAAESAEALISSPNVLEVPASEHLKDEVGGCVVGERTSKIPSWRLHHFTSLDLCFVM
ncbi:unnamed protein product [Symbiodinium necroappetens]|uniref:Uncharacterized protein n=1 Tax=Symbiodinium necroappetens TaxID=1628268 RepID=A0A812Q8E9_9DINO|nr:unnamed protein product [Symbiodinium necroappetens]